MPYWLVNFYNRMDLVFFSEYPLRKKHKLHFSGKWWHASHGTVKISIKNNSESPSKYCKGLKWTANKFS